MPASPRNVPVELHHLSHPQKSASYLEFLLFEKVTSLVSWLKSETLGSFESSLLFASHIYN